MMFNDQVEAQANLLSCKL